MVTGKPSVSIVASRYLAPLGLSFVGNEVYLRGVPPPGTGFPSGKPRDLWGVVTCGEDLERVFVGVFVGVLLGVCEEMIWVLWR